MSRRPLRALAAAAVLLVAAPACSPEEAPPSGDAAPTRAATALGSEPPDPRIEALTAEVAGLRATVAAARDALVTARDATGRAAADAAEDAVALLLADAPLGPDDEPPAPAPLFPGGPSSRQETIDYGDAFTRTLTRARDAGTPGARVVDLLRDPVAGDIGTWQRDTDGVLDQIRDAARPTDDVPAAEAAVAELPGEATKALAWALLAEDAGSDALRSAFAERGVAHLDLVLDALDGLPVVSPTGGEEDP